MVVWSVSLDFLKSRHQDRIRYASILLVGMPVKENREETVGGGESHQTACKSDPVRKREGRKPGWEESRVQCCSAQGESSSHSCPSGELPFHRNRSASVSLLCSVIGWEPMGRMGSVQCIGRSKLKCYPWPTVLTGEMISNSKLEQCKLRSPS